jgi:hypothetical protein
MRAMLSISQRPSVEVERQLRVDSGGGALSSVGRGRGRGRGRGGIVCGGGWSGVGGIAETRVGAVCVEMPGGAVARYDALAVLGDGV